MEPAVTPTAPSWMTRFFSWINPAGTEKKTAWQRLLITIVIIAAVTGAVLTGMEVLAFTMLVVFFLTTMVFTVMPRSLILWFQYQPVFIELVFGVLIFSFLGGGMSWAAMTTLAAASSVITVAKVENLAWKNKKAGRTNTLYEWALMQSNSLGQVPWWLRYLTSANADSLRPDYVYDESRTGPLGLWYLLWNAKHWLSCRYFGGDPRRDYFSPKPPSGKVRWWKLAAMKSEKRAEAKVNAAEALDEFQLRQVRLNMQAEKRAELDELLKTGDLAVLTNAMRLGDLAKELERLEEQLS